MSTVTRGVRNAFRNPTRTVGVTTILALSIGLAIVMLLALKTVQTHIAAVKASIGNTVTISPAGSRGFEGGGEPLTQADLDVIKSVPHVTKLATSLSDRLAPGTDTSLASAIDPGTLGTRFRNRGFGGDSSGDSSGSAGNPTRPRAFSIPIMVNGVSEVAATTANASSLKFTAGSAIDPASTTNTANLGLDLATKNNLTVGSTFTAYNTTITVTGIYDAGNRFANAELIMPIATVQKLSGQPGQVSSATVTISDITSVNGAVTAIKAKLGDKADVVSQQDAATNALAPLENIRTISLSSLIGALVAGAIIIFLTMLMIVRERRREIGVLKAIGASNLGITNQFVTEALTFTAMGAVVGTLGGLLLSNPILRLLVTSSATSTINGGGLARGSFGGGPRGLGRVLGQLGGQTLQNLQATIGWDILLYGLLAAILIAVLGSAIPAYLIANVRPAEVMRGE